MPVEAPSAEKLIDMYTRMWRIRLFEEQAEYQSSQGKVLGALHTYIGEEAVGVGVCAHLHDTDYITSTHRGHGHCIAKGADIKRMMAELFGRVDGYCKGKGGSMHIADFAVGMLGANGIVGGGLPIAAGAALAAQLEGRGGVAVCFFGDGATGEGEFHEALNIASIWKLPLIFVCENNQYAANNAVEVQRKVPDVSAHAGAYDMPGVTIDGNDVLAVYETTSDAVERARRGDGPTLIECKTYRWHFHAMRNTPPPDTRPADEIAAWKSQDPIARFETHLKAQGLITDDDVAAIRDRVKGDLDEAVAFADASPFPDPKDLLVDMFAA
jgi:acetoin:2,6-dichlorophenolindophenol oxidoreductase subunit alpha